MDLYNIVLTWNERVPIWFNSKSNHGVAGVFSEHRRFSCSSLFSNFVASHSQILVRYNILCRVHYFIIYFIVVAELRTHQTVSLTNWLWATQTRLVGTWTSRFPETTGWFGKVVRYWHKWVCCKASTLVECYLYINYRYSECRQIIA